MVLLFHGANKDARDSIGRMVLRTAATCGEAAVVNLLLRLGTDRSAATYGGRMENTFNNMSTVQNKLLRINVNLFDNTAETISSDTIISEYSRLQHHIAEAASGGLHVPVVKAVTVQHFICWGYTDEVPERKGNAAKPQAPAETCKPPLLKEACEDQSPGFYIGGWQSCHKGGTHEAAKYGNLAELLEILQHGMDINSQCGNGYTAIHRMAKCGDTSAVNWLLESGANVTVWSDWQQTTLQVAAAYGRQGVVMVLLFHGADKDAWDGCGQTALQIAARCGEAAVLNLLLWLGTDQSAAGYARLQHHIAEAASGGLHVPVVKAVTVQHFICWGYTDEVPERKGNAAKPQAPAETCKPPLLKEACEDQSPGFYIGGWQREEERPALVTATKQRIMENRMQEAAENGNFAELAKILTQGIHVDSQCENGYTALCRGEGVKAGDIVHHGRKLPAGVGCRCHDKDAWDGCGQTALQIAATYGEAAVVNLLLQLGMDRSAPSYGGRMENTFNNLSTVQNKLLRINVNLFDNTAETISSDTIISEYSRLPHHIAEAASGGLHVPVVKAVTVQHFICWGYTVEVPERKGNVAKPQAPAETCKPPPLKEACEDQSVQGFTLEDGRVCGADIAARNQLKSKNMSCSTYDLPEDLINQVDKGRPRETGEASTSSVNAIDDPGDFLHDFEI
ncbi:ankyrin-3-like [Schistocerca americana]|uniref:ankyrin-3-like n=1 Tax=Schistocerca americana TaxID=7009 RepID=UPI001F501A88|nr:ankyrin-3-like [Schistocerca americana]